MGAYEEIISGNVLNGTMSVYTEIMGGWFFVILGLIIPTAVYLKTESPEATGMTMFIIGMLGTGGTVSGFIGRFPGASGGTGNIMILSVWVLMTVVGISMIAFKWWRQR